MSLRPYQQAAHDAVINWVKKSDKPCLIEAATGAGKSHIVAAIAHTINTISNGKRVLVIMPSAELVKQNYAKYMQTGNPASIYSASISKCLKHDVVFATPLSIKGVVNKKSNFAKNFAMIIIDEAHGITPTIQSIVRDMKRFAPNIRVVGLTATPYRMGSGYIYRENIVNGRVEKETVNPYFRALVYKIGAHKLINMGFLTPPKLGGINATTYDTSMLQLNSMGKFKQDGIDKAFIGQGRKTALIVADVLHKAQNRKGVMFFASTIQHAQELMDSLPAYKSALVTGKTPNGERADILRRFLNREIKYLVNVSVLTTGFDAPHVDLIAILRATESVGLLQQIIGRGLRLCDNKRDCLVLDYAENIERHCPDGDVFNPTIKAFKSNGGGEPMRVLCPDCDEINEFTPRKNDDGYGIDNMGYFTDLEGNRVEVEFGDEKYYVPAHFGRRCQTLLGVPPNHVQCGYRWISKPCPQCDAENDIAARYCSDCKAEIIDPNDKLIEDFKEMKKDPYQVQCDTIINVVETPTVSKSGREIILLSITTEYRAFKIYLQVESEYKRAKFEYDLWEYVKKTGWKTITYKKQHDKNFYNLIAFNEPKDEVKSL